MPDCIIGLKKVLDKNPCHPEGDAFDRLMTCCKKFEDLFERPIDVFDIFNKRSHGISIGKEENYQIFFHGTKIDFCPFCGARLKICQLKIVERIRKRDAAFDEYEEKNVTLNFK